MLDIIFLITIASAMYKGYGKGLIVAVFSFVALMVGLVAALKLSAYTAGWLQGHTAINYKWLPVLSFAITFFAAAAVVRFTAKFVQEAASALMLGWVNKLGGMLLYAVVHVAVLSVFIYYANKIHLLSSNTLQQSTIYPYFKNWGSRTIDVVSVALPFIKDIFIQLGNFFEALPHQKI